MKNPVVSQDASLDASRTFDDSSLKISDILFAVGFDLMLAWHYLVLFSPVFTSDYGIGITDYLFERQLALYTSLAVAFACIGIISATTSKRGVRLWQKPVVIGVLGLFAVLSSTLCAMLPVSNDALFIASTVALGIAEACLMFAWLNAFTTLNIYSQLPSFSLFMLAGGFIALIICCLQWPISLIASILAPGLSSLILAMRIPKIVGTVEHEDTDVSSGSAKSDSSSIPDDRGADASGEGSTPRSQLRWNWYVSVSVGVFALAFGVLQGAFVVADITLLMVENPFVLLGIVFAGLIIRFIPDSFGNHISVDLMHRYSLVLFVIGVVFVAWSNYSSAFLLISQIAILAAFNLFDFGVMVNGLSDGQSNPNEAVRVIEGGRPSVYACLAIGLLVGFMLVHNIPVEHMRETLVVICGASIIALVATTLIPYYRFFEITKENDEKGMAVDLSSTYQPVEIAAANYSHDSVTDMQKLPENWVSPWKNACTQIAKLYQLSPRETEIFFLIAKGRNADYVQQKLVISTHTAKTHIANIYRKLEVHSSQELLDLVEAFRDAERRLEESDDE